MLLVIKVLIFGILVIIGLAGVAACLVNQFEDEENCTCPITCDYCKYDYSVFSGGNPCKDCDVFKEWKGEFDGRENREL